MKVKGKRDDGAAFNIKTVQTQAEVLSYHYLCRRGSLSLRLLRRGTKACRS